MLLLSLSLVCVASPARARLLVPIAGSENAEPSDRAIANESHDTAQTLLRRKEDNREVNPILASARNHDALYIDLGGSDSIRDGAEAAILLPFGVVPDNNI